MQIIQNIQNRIYEVRGERVMLDYDLAAIYEVETKVLNQAVKRNLKRFPCDFMFRLSAKEWGTMRSQIVTSYSSGSSKIQVLASDQTKRKSSLTPFAFTEQGIAMLSSVLHSEKAINMNIAIMRAFIEIRKVLLQQNDLKEQLRLVKDKLGEHDAQLNQIYDALENILDEKVAQRKWEDRDRIGFAR
jgi:hypothetical protein